MRSAIVAMLWENWRLSRVEAAQRFALGILAGSAAMVLSASATAAFCFLVAIHAFFWFSIAKLNGGKFIDGYKPGFPLYLLYTRPVSTAVFVGVAMLYDALSSVALYLISAALLVLTFGQPLPMLSVALLLVTVHFVFICIQWSTRNRIFQWTGSIAITFPLVFLFKDGLTALQKIEFSLVEHVFMVLVCIVSFGLTVAGVARQRRGDSDVKAPRKEGSGGYPEWMINLFRFPCPTSSATRAQLWYELRSSGLPVLTLGLTSSVLIFLLFAIGIVFSPIRDFAIGIPLLAVLGLFTMGVNAFGIRRRQGRMYVSAFEATQPYGTQKLAGIKVLVRTLCMLIALTAIGVSVWASSSLMSEWSPWPYLVEGGKDAAQDVLKWRQEIAGAISSQSGYALAAFALMLAIFMAIMIASLATFMALRARYRRRMLVAVSLLLCCGFALILLAWAVNTGIVSQFLLGAMLTAAKWIGGAALVFTTIYLLWTGFAERTLTIRYVCGAAAIAAAVFGTAWFAGMPATEAVGMLWLAILVLIVMPPWSLSRIRVT
jgi:hypothetical protein